MSVVSTISGIPSQKFFQKYSYIHILNVLGITCNKKNPPTAVACPKCRETCWIHGIMPFGGWLNCESCGLTGDPIRVYEQVYRIKSFAKLRDALEEEFRSGGSFDEDWELYYDFYRGYYQGVEKLWKAAKRNASNYGQNYHARRLYDLGLWRDQNTFNKHMANSVGMVHRGQLTEILGEEPLGIRRQPFIRMLVMPYYWVPGFITGFALLGSNDHIHYISTLPDYFGGFFNLTNSFVKAKATFAVDSPIQILRTMLKGGIEGVKFPTIVSPHSSQIVDWGSLYGTLVYWHDDPPPEELRRYLVAGNSQIIPIDCPPIWVTDKKRMAAWEDTIGPKVVRSLESTRGRRSTLKYCIDTIFSKKTKAPEYLERLSPTVQTKYLLLSKCLSYQKRRLTNLFEDIDFQETIQIKGNLIYEKQGKWWARNRRHRREDMDEVVSEVILVIETVYRNYDLSASSYAGHILYKNLKIQFVVSARELQKNPRDYVELICAHAGVEVLPYISDWGRQNLIKAAELFRPPEVVKVRDTVGFDSLTGKFYLPQTLISSSSIEAGGQYVYPAPDLPGNKVGCQLEKGPRSELEFNPSMLKSWLTPHYECVGYWAAVASLMYAIFSKVQGKPSTGVVLVGDKGSLAEHLFNIFRYDMDLLKSNLNTFTANKRAFESGEHDLPLAVDGLRCQKTGLRNWIDKTESPNTLLLADPLYAGSMGPDPDWVFIRAEEKPLGGDTILAGTEVAIPSILQYMLITQPQSLEDSFEGCAEIARNVEVGDQTIERARRITSHRGYINSRSELACFINMLDEMSEQGILGTRAEVKVCEDRDEVIININLIHKTARRARLYARRWDIRNQLKTFGFEAVEDSAEVKYKGSFKVWQRLVHAVRRLRHTQGIRNQTYAKESLK
jgi:hypothetical protein